MKKKCAGEFKLITVARFESQQDMVQRQIIRPELYG